MKWFGKVIIAMEMWGESIPNLLAAKILYKWSECWDSFKVE